MALPSQTTQPSSLRCLVVVIPRILIHRQCFNRDVAQHALALPSRRLFALNLHQLNPTHILHTRVCAKI